MILLPAKHAAAENNTTEAQAHCQCRPRLLTEELGEVVVVVEGEGGGGGYTIPESLFAS